MRGSVETVCLLLLVLPVLLAGCASIPRPGALPDRTGGLSVDYFTRTTDERLMRYRVEPSGRISFSGGTDALGDRIGWTGDLTDEEIQALRGLLEARDWYAQSPASAEDVETPFYRVRLIGPGFRRQFEARGSNESLEAMGDLLAAASARRLDPELDRLPKPGVQP